MLNLDTILSRNSFFKRANALRKKYQMDERTYEPYLQVLEQIVFSYKFHDGLPFYVEISISNTDVSDSEGFSYIVSNIARELEIKSEYFSLNFSNGIYRGSFRFF